MKATTKMSFDDLVFEYEKDYKSRHYQRFGQEAYDFNIKIYKINIPEIVRHIMSEDSIETNYQQAAESALDTFVSDLRHDYDWIFNWSTEGRSGGWLTLVTNDMAFVDGILDEIDLTGYDAHLRPAWLHLFPRVVAPFRYPGHGFQMIASYFGQMAPSGRITITAALQSADEMRRIQRIAYRIRQLQQIYPGFAADSRTLWETDSLWQPLREVVEKLLIAYDWAESFVGLNLVLKPLVDELFMKYLSEVALGEDDYLLGQIFYSLNEDCQWHRQWSESLVRMALEDNVHNRDTIQNWIHQWYPLAARAVQPFTSLLEGTLQQMKAPAAKSLEQAIDRYYRDYLQSMSLQVDS